MTSPVRPLHLQVLDQLFARITSGQWKAAASLPSETELARKFGCSIKTIRKSLDLMTSLQLLTKAAWGRVLVAEGAARIIADNTQQSTNLEIRDIAKAPADARERLRLHLDVAHEVWRFRRLRSRNDQLFMVEDVSLPATMFPGLGKDASAPADLTKLAFRYGMLVGKAEERVETAQGPPSVAELLDVSSNTLLVM
jgi:GntR family transcriptional regulator